MHPVYFENNFFSNLQAFFSSHVFSSVYVLADENTVHHCYPKIASYFPSHYIIQIKSGEESKNIGTCQFIWQKLTGANTDRKTLLINLGGGVIGDIGGFAAGCYKRGIKFINVPTTLLAMVDASVGAKCGIDFMGYKNQIGLFNKPEAVFIYTDFLETLPERELRAGFAEAIKHYLIADRGAFEEVRSKKLEVRSIKWDTVVRKNVAIKHQIVEQDLTEQGIRKALNFGHTVGHALESFFLNNAQQKLLHGEAVAIGMVCESFISYRKGLLSKQELQQVASIVLPYFNYTHIAEQHFESIIELIAQDKKNEATETRFTLLNGIGSCIINQPVEKDLIRESLVYFNSLHR